MDLAYPTGSVVRLDAFFGDIGHQVTYHHLILSTVQITCMQLIEKLLQKQGLCNHLIFCSKQLNQQVKMK